MLYKGGDLRLAAYAYYTWEMALNTGLDVSCYNIYDWKGKRENSVDVSSRKNAGISK
jgi:hypothetical protein